MSFSVEEILQFTGGRLVNGDALGASVSTIKVSKPTTLAGSTSSNITFFFSREYEQELLRASPGIMITGQAFVKPMEAARLPLWSATAIIACDDPYYAMALLSEKFAALVSTVAHVRTNEETEIHPSAVIHSSATIGRGTKIGANCVIEEGARIGAGSVLYPGCYVGPKVEMGEHCVLFPNVTLYEWTQIGDRIRIHANTVIGADGFGYAPKRSNGAVIGHQKIYHLGKVVIGNDVEIGANSCVDRSTMGETRIGNQAKLDNKVHIGHNAEVGDGAVICGGVCLAGRTRVGKFAYIGGMTGISNQVSVGDGATVGAMSLLSKDVPPKGAVLGNPQRDHKEHFKVHAMLNRMCADRESKRKTKE